MSNAARKARKRSGEKFAKAPKVGTPILERSTKPVLRSNIVERGTESQRFKKKLVNQFMVSDEAQRRSDAWNEAYAAEPEEEVLELDPKPYRIGRKRYAVNDLTEMATGNWPDNTTPNDLIWSPRKQYEQDAKHYQQ